MARRAAVPRANLLADAAHVLERIDAAHNVADVRVNELALEAQLQVREDLLRRELGQVAQLPRRVAVEPVHVDRPHRDAARRRRTADPLRAVDVSKGALADLRAQLVSVLKLAAMANDEFVVVVNELLVLREK